MIEAKLEIRIMTDKRRFMSYDLGLLPENWKLATGNCRLATGNWKPETENCRLSTGNRKP